MARASMRGDAREAATLEPATDITAHPAAVCLGCGCTCDDIDLVVSPGRIVEARNACDLGRAWFGSGAVVSRSVAEGRDVAWSDAVAQAASLLAGARRPLVYLAPDLTCEAQRAAIAVADVLRASIDSISSTTALASIVAAQERGRTGATLGEVRNRADLLLFWAADPARTHPRFVSRYAADSGALHLPDGARGRTIAAVDVGDDRGPLEASVRAQVAVADEVALLTLLREAVTPTRASARDAGGGTRSPLASALDVLSPLLRRAGYIALVADAEQPDHDKGRASALAALGQALNGVTRCAVIALRGGGNRSGADAVLTWQTGFPLAVDFTRGAPRYRPFDGSAAICLASGEVDVLLLLGSSRLVPPELVQAMRPVPAIVIGPRASEGPLTTARVAIDTGVPGIHEAGTALRMDDVPLPLRGVLDGPVSTADALAALLSRLHADGASRA